MSRRRCGARFFLIGALISTAAAVAARQTPKFYDDDPLRREPETQDASGVQGWDNVLSYDLLLNLFGRPGDSRRIRALNVNTIDEVPDSNWFTNRMLEAPLSIEEAVRGPIVHAGPAPGPMTVLRAKPAGMAPGFVGRDSAGVTWFLQFDAAGHPEAATGASMVANRLFHALGYWQMEYHLTEIRQDTLRIDPQAVTETPSGAVRQIDHDDMARVFRRAARQPDGTYRALASRNIGEAPGAVKIVGGFRYHGTRPDDPNDVVPHEHRRELRALKVFGAWANLVDMKAGNTLDVVVAEGGRQVVRHYLQDVGSTFGASALGPRDWDEGYEYLYEGSATWKRLVTFGFHLRDWQKVPYDEQPAIGRFEGTAFDPVTWKPRVPTAAFHNARPDDTFWAARRVMAFTDEMIRAVAEVGGYRDREAVRHLADVLIARRDRIGAAYLPAVNPIVDVALSPDGVLTFRNAAVDARVAAVPAGGYRGEWYRFDNATSTSSALGETISPDIERLPAPGRLPQTPGAFVRVAVSAVRPPHPSWTEPVEIYFRRTPDGWALVGFERLPAGPID